MKFSVRYHTEWGESLALKTGASTFPMEYGEGDVWSVDIPRPSFKVKQLYHYEVLRDGRIIRTEEAWHFLLPADTQTPARQDFWLDNPKAPGSYRGAGVAVPVFSLRSTEDFGIGEFLDIKFLVDWAVKCNLEIIQILPVNDTTATGTYLDSYPYNPISNFALHPIYLNLPAAGVSTDAAYRKAQRSLNLCRQVDYEKVIAEKHRLLRESYARNWESLKNTARYAAFFKTNRSWLLPYAVFCALRDEFHTADFTKWDGYSTYSKALVNEYCKNHTEQVEYWFFLQYHLDAQLSEVVEYAHSHGVMLKGDIPIGVNRCSADCWMNPSLFNMDSQAGAPPDFFSSDGQNWGFPTYNWDEMEKDGFAWWKARLGNMSKYFDAYRLDHILGFFRIWEIPVSRESGKEGHFNPALPYSGEELRSWGYDPCDRRLFVEDPLRKDWFHPRIDAPREGGFAGLYEDFFYRRHNDFWYARAMKKLPALVGATDMLPCAEDLGMLADCVPVVMDELDILSLELQLMPKAFGEHFGNVGKYPYRSVCTTTTHDMCPLRAWWVSDRDRAQDYYNNVLGAAGKAPQAPESWIFREMLRSHLGSSSMLTIIPIQDYLAIDEDICTPDPLSERVNDPAEPHHYWRYRLHLNLEQLVRAERLSADVASLVRRYR